MPDKEFIKIISPDAEDRLRIRLATERGKVVNIMVQYEARSEMCGVKLSCMIAHMATFTGTLCILAGKRRSNR